MATASRRLRQLSRQLCDSSAAPPDLEVLIVGAGFSGLLNVVALDDAGLPPHEVAIVEAGPDCGGVWRSGGVGNYPGAACDVQAYTYLPLLQRVGFVPSKKYVTQTEICSYANLLAERLNIRPRIRFNTRVTAVRFIESESMWEATLSQQSDDGVTKVLTQRARHFVLACGPLSTPRMPGIDGLGSFHGPSFHTARWDHEVDLRGKKVGVVGTGASAAQVITAIAAANDRGDPNELQGGVSHLYVFQRTPVWAMPRDDEPTPAELRLKIEHEGGYLDTLRREATRESEVTLFPALHDEKGNEMLQAEVRKVINAEVPEGELRQLLTPDYPFFCKRVLFIDNYYKAFTRADVSLIADDRGVASETERGVRLATSGDEVELDVLIYATGFDALNVQFPVVGKGGVTLVDKWGGEDLPYPKTLYGIHVGSMPNFYMMIGPQSINPVTNITLVSEDQARYVAKLVMDMRSSGQQEVEPTAEAEEAWTKRTVSTSEGKVWLRCSNWYMKTAQQDGKDKKEGEEDEAYFGMWMEKYSTYLDEAIGTQGGGGRALLRFS